MSPRLGTATPADTRAEVTRLAARGYTQLRHVLVQLPDADQPRASTLARMLHERKHRPLLLYIMLLTCWPWLAERRGPLEAEIWIRALSAKGAPTWSRSTLSRAWADLEAMGLIERKREGRLVRITPRREDGGADYEAPRGRTDRWNTYFALPDAFWTDEIFAQLKLPGLIMLLVVAKETNAKREVWLSYEQAEKWYGIKAKSMQNGLNELEAAGLVKRRRESIMAPLSPTGSTTKLWFSLTGDFGHTSRVALQARAAKERTKRVRRKATASTEEVGE